MKFNNHNERKKFVLALLNHSIEPFTARQIANSCYPVSINSIRTSLKRYCNQGLLRRKRENKKTPYKYSISSKGIERLEYLLGDDNSIKNQIELLVREPLRSLRG